MRLLMKLFALSIGLNSLGLQAQTPALTVKPINSLSIDVSNKVRLQKGAALYMNYCSGCHSLKYLRYDRMAKDLSVTTSTGDVDEALLKSNLIFTEARVYDPIHIAMPAEDALQWFGMLPPDLSLTARARGTIWLYNYLHGFYKDDSRPFGANNLLIPDVAMPNVFAPLIGEVLQVAGAHPALKIQQPGTMSQSEFDDTVLDLVTFLAYVAEPAQLIRYRLGPFVLFWLSCLLILVYLLKRSYWHDLKREPNP